LIIVPVAAVATDSISITSIYDAGYASTMMIPSTSGFSVTFTIVIDIDIINDITVVAG
jgi:hypothetical protein